jgi:hypothetical protein
VLPSGPHCRLAIRAPRPPSSIDYSFALPYWVAPTGLDSSLLTPTDSPAVSLALTAPVAVNSSSTSTKSTQLRRQIDQLIVAFRSRSAVQRRDRAEGSPAARLLTRDQYAARHRGRGEDRSVLGANRSSESSGRDRAARDASRSSDRRRSTQTPPTRHTPHATRRVTATPTRHRHFYASHHPTRPSHPVASHATSTRHASLLRVTRHPWLITWPPTKYRRLIT